jgi:hypothetical protein
VTWVKWKLVSVRLEIVLICGQDWCIDLDKHAKGSEIIFGTNNGASR